MKRGVDYIGVGVGAVIVDAQGRLFFARRGPQAKNERGLWEFPGGKVEPMEDPLVCVVREIREELGIEIAVERIYDVVYYRYPERTVLVLAYQCRWLSGVIEDLEVAEHRWIPPKEIINFQLLPADVPLAARISREMCGADTPYL